MEASGGFQTDWNMNPTICRLCLHSDGFLLGIFNHLHGKEKNIYKKIVDCTALEISSGDGLPHTICHRCLFKLELCLDFRAQCFVSDSTLRQASRIAHAQRCVSSSNEPIASLMDLVPPQPGDSGDVVVVVDPSAVDYDSDYENSKYGRPNSNEHYHHDQPSAMAQMAANIGHYGPHVMMNHTPNDSHTANIHDQQILSDNETNEIADNGGEIYDFRNVFMCRYCDRAFTDKPQCTRHETEDHHPTEPYSCKTCQLSFPDRLHYSAHLKSQHADDKPYDCPECEKMFARRSDLRKHTIVHTGIKPFTCPVCSKSFSRNTNLSKHMRIHAGHKPFVCPRCPKTFITRGDLQRHSLIHSGRKPFPCRYCNLSFSRRDKLLRHEKRHFPAGAPMENSRGGDNVRTADKNGDYSGENMVIDIDPIYTADNESATINDNTGSLEQEKPMSPDRHEDRPFDNTAANINEADIDPTRDTNRQIYEKGHKKRRQLKGVMMSHVTGDENEQEEEKEEDIGRELTPLEKAAKSKRYPCLQCHRRFSNMEGLKFHIQQYHNTSVNTSNRPFPCPQCPKGFIRKRELERHMTTHSGMKPFSCTSCDKRFGRKDKLVRHMRIHDGSNLHVCPICTIAFSRKDTLWQHVRNHQRQEQFQYQAAQQQPNELLNESSSRVPSLNDNSSSIERQTPSVSVEETKEVAASEQPIKGSSLLQDYLEEETLSSSSNYREKVIAATDDGPVEEDLDPDFEDERVEEEESKENVFAAVEKRHQQKEDDFEDADKVENKQQDKERSSEFDEEDDEEEDEEYDEDKHAENPKTNAEIDHYLNDDKDLVGEQQQQDDNSYMETSNVQANIGDPDYDDDVDLDDNDDDMGEEEEEDDDQDGGENTNQRQDGDQQQQQQLPQHEDQEIIDCDASGDEDSNQYGDQQQQQQQQQHDDGDNDDEEEEKRDFIIDKLDQEADDDFDEDDDDEDEDDDVQMSVEPRSVIF